jgi:hypothetical protein
MTRSIVSTRKALLENLTGVPAAEFVRSYWGKSYLHARSGPVVLQAVLGGRWSVAEFRAAIERGYRWPGSPRTLQALPVSGQSHLEQRHISLEQLDDAVASGATIIGDALDEHLLTVAAALKDELNVAGPVSAYGSLSAAGEGALPHYDSSHVFVLQLEGRKQWRLSQGPVVINPSRGRRISPDGEVDATNRSEDEALEQVALDQLDTVVLERGDILYVPIGMLHATEALERSLSVMFNFAPPRFDALVELLVRRTLGGEAKWRGLPAGASQSVYTDYMNEGMARLRGILSVLDADSAETRAAWDEMTANMGAMLNSFAASLSSANGGRITPDCRLKVTPRYPVRHWERIDSQGELRITVYLGDRQITDNGAGAELLRQILVRGEFTAEEARYWSGDAFEWDVVCGYLDGLVQQGLLTTA